jgi:hypothetical protein
VQRLHEIERLIGHRHGFLPDTDDADVYLYQVACCLMDLAWKKSLRRPGRDALNDRLNVWCEGRGPGISAKLRRDAVAEAWSHRRIDNADECAQKLRVSYAERTKLHLTTIGAYDADKLERARRYKARKRERDRRRARARRATSGAVTREVYLATSLSRGRPWKDQGISRRTWERQRARVQKRDASPSPTNSLNAGR